MESCIKQATRVIAKLQNTAPRSNKLHQKQRRLANLCTRHQTLKADHDADTIRLCFGSKKRFHAQFDLEANGYASHTEWKTDWQKSRNNQFFVLGSQDETAGNQSCQASQNQDGTLNLQLRLPNALDRHGKHLTLTGVCFAYGQEQIVAALASSQRIRSTTQSGRAAVKRTGTALSYRFIRDGKSWRVLVSVEAQPIKPTTSKLLGAIGIDINVDHLAVTETDRYGNLISTRRIDLVTYGKTPEQAKALIGDAAVSIAEQARAAGKPVVIERLNFQKKKAELETADPKQARLLSSFACTKIISSIRSACFRAGVEVVEVNPAYTSVIGAVNHARIKGISVHQAAAYAVARRGMGLSERPTVREAITPTRNGGHVTFALPVRNRAKHVWSFWSNVRTKLKAAHVAHYRCGDHQRSPPPIPPSTPVLGAIWSSTVKSRGANRHQYCSDGVLGDVPQ